ncbi:MAG TPA: hypothetical protein VMB50_14085 [Myxococcales bacterium]|nr:hypothetical protein [Myxococcales bacterium]
MTRRSAGGASRLAAAGALAGLAGGAAMALLAMILSATAGLSPWHPVSALLVELAPSSALGAAVIPFGLFLHLVASVFLGMLFAALFGQFPEEVLLPAGALYGLGIWLVIRYVAFPAASFATSGATPALVAEYLVYGSMLWLLVPIDSWLEKRL